MAEPPREGGRERAGAREYVRWSTPPSRGLGPRWDRFRARAGGELMAEFFGTLILVALGCGSAAVAVVGLSGSGRQTEVSGPWSRWRPGRFGWADRPGCDPGCGYESGEG